MFVKVEYSIYCLLWGNSETEYVKCSCVSLKSKRISMVIVQVCDVTLVVICYANVY